MRPHAPHYNAEQNKLIEEEVADLLQKGAVSHLVESQSKGGLYSNLFLVPKRDGGQRPVINLKALNQFVQPCHFKMEGIHTLRDLIKQGDWLAKVDLKDAYFTIPIHASQRKYLRFMMAGQAYEFNCLPFGLSSAPWVFTKTLKPVAALLREMGVRMIVYIDDILILAETKGKAQEQAKALVYLLECLGFIINKKRSELKPAQIMDFLGLTVDTVLMQLRLPGGKMKKIRAEARRMEREERVSARYQEGGGSDNRVRCITDRLGSSMSGAEDRRSLDTSRIPDVHQLPGASSSHICSADVRKEHNWDINTTEIAHFMGRPKEFNQAAEHIRGTFYSNHSNHNHTSLWRSW